MLAGRLLGNREWGQSKHYNDLVAEIIDEFVLESWLYQKYMYIFDARALPI